MAYCAGTKLISKGKSEESFCIRFLSEKNRNFNIFKFFLLNIALFSGGFIILTLTNCAEHFYKGFLFTVLIHALELIYLIVKFDIYKLKIKESPLKLMYIFTASFMNTNILTIYYFLIIFENISSFCILEGI